MKKSILLIALGAFYLTGCGGDDHAGHDHEGHDHANHEGHDHSKAKTVAKTEEGSGSHGHEQGSHKTMDKAVYFIEPAHNAKVKSPFKVKFGLKGMTVKPAGTMDKDTGHHHLLINKMAISEGEVIPADEKHIHFGAGQTETDLTLEPGEYVLTMQFANGLHQSYGPNMSSAIKVIVEK